MGESNAQPREDSTHVAKVSVEVRRAHPEDRVALRKFQALNHLDATGYCSSALETQISELKPDFPDLYDERAFNDGWSWVAEIVGRASSFNNESNSCSSSSASSASSSSQSAIVGCIGMIRDSADADGTTAYLSFLSVHPDMRGQGLGDYLLQLALNEAVSLGFKRIHLLTLKCMYAAACRLYARAGFTAYKELEYNGDGWKFSLVWLELPLLKWNGGGEGEGAVSAPNSSSSGAEALKSCYKTKLKPKWLEPQEGRMSEVERFRRPREPNTFKWTGRAERISEALELDFTEPVVARYELEVAAAAASAAVDSAMIPTISEASDAAGDRLATSTASPADSSSKPR